MAALAGAAASSAASSGGTPVLLGGPVFIQDDDPRAIAREHRNWGYAAGYCPEAKVEDAERVRAIREAFAAENVVIAEVGAWVNMMDRDEAKRRKNLDYVTRRLALAEETGARCCVNIAGSWHPEIWYGPHPGNFSQEFFDGTVENCRRVIDAVKPKRTHFTIEMMGWTIPDSPDSYLKLIDAVDREAFAVHIDVCNSINSPYRFYGNSEFIRECFQKLGERAVSCHAKDLAWEVEFNVHFREVVPGRGEVNYATYLRELAKLPAPVPLMLEHLRSPREYEEGRDFIRKTGEEAGVKFG